ncbi:anthrax toxin lethal factor-related metalloendopeptidase [Aquibacillus salsiterrae]|uniref:ATLF-like domain-containing protein n=1 Tax=Aquibacillus salsiterrae TaxID=2950439 RepID=A0A9X3WBR4_9BACI|nr:hypothetical protein [Aquibacillus salsiterrae]MDC3415326.1 hypothetical protein [Aquibacillus salsiterrae]
MKKLIKHLKVIIVVLIFSFLPFMDITKPFNGVLLQKAHGIEDSFPMENLTNADFLNQLVIVPNEISDQLSLFVMLERINRIDRPVLQLLVVQGVKIRLFEGSLTDEPLLAYLKSERPRGYKGDVTWDDVPGSGGSWLISAKIGSSMPGNGHSSINLELHEIGHTVYNLLLTDRSFATSLEDAWKLEVKTVFGKKEYFNNYESEYFSEMFASYYYSDSSNYDIKKNAPETYRVLSNLESLKSSTIQPNYYK